MKTKLIISSILCFFLCGCDEYEARKKEKSMWPSFKSQHHCKVVSHIEREWVYKGSTCEKDGWLCDDGITYFKCKGNG